MIETKDLEEFLRYKVHPNLKYDDERECFHEIVARLKAYDKLKESIELLLAKLCPDVSNGVDK